MSNNHSDDDWPYPHPKQPDIEDGPLTEHMIMAEAVEQLPIDKGIFSAAEMRQMLEKIDSQSPAEGARMVARAWLDPDFKARMLEDVNRAAEEMDIDAGPIPILAIENTPEIHNAIVCTLCSCYPWPVLGLPPTWYKSAPYRARAVADPRGVLKEFGTELSDNTQIRVWDSTAEMRYLVLPERPADTDDWSAEDLALLVSRNAMIGTAKARLPTKARRK